MEYFKRNYPEITVEKLNECGGRGPSGTDIIVGMRKDPDVLELRIPMPMMMHPAREQNLFDFVVALEESIGGVVVRYPLAIVFGEGS